jgi:hypothetical protein
MTSIKGAIVSTVFINPRYIFVKVPGSGNMGSKVQGSTFRVGLNRFALPFFLQITINSVVYNYSTQQEALNCES